MALDGDGTQEESIPGRAAAKMAADINAIADLPHWAENRFRGIKVLVTGDSLTEANFRSSKVWHQYLKDWLGFATVFNDGKSGSGLVRNRGIVYRLANWTAAYGSDIDMILIMGPMNDGTGGPTGRWDWIYGPADEHPGDYATPITSSNCADSLWNALRWTCETILSQYPSIPVGFIVSTPRNKAAIKRGEPRPGYDTSCHGSTSWFEEWTEVIKEVCGHYAIPVLDLYHESGLRPWDAIENQKYFSCPRAPLGDGVHLNAEGHEVIARKILPWILQEMGKSLGEQA